MASSTTQTPNTWEGVVQAAQKAGAKFPELVAAQWALESNWGKHTSGRHNYFGLKGEGTITTTQEYVDGKPVTIKDGFLNFKTFDECVEYLVTRWYKDFKGFKGVNGSSSVAAAAKELQAQGYATNPGYAGMLLKLVSERGAKAAPVAPKAPEAKPLFTITATQETLLKKAPKQAVELSEAQVSPVKRGKAYAVMRYEECPADGHSEVALGGGAGTWFVFDPHWKRSGLGGETTAVVVDWSDFSCRVMPNLTVGEILQFDKRRTPGANSAVVARLMRTALEYQKVREAWGRGLGVTSFYRPADINAAVGGVPNSKHITGEAMDVYPVDRSLETFYQWIRVRWRGGLGDGRNRGFIHLDTVGGGFVPGAGVRPTRQWTY